MSLATAVLPSPGKLTKRSRRSTPESVMSVFDGLPFVGSIPIEPDCKIRNRIIEVQGTRLVSLFNDRLERVTHGLVHVVAYVNDYTELVGICFGFGGGRTMAPLLV